MYNELMILIVFRFYADAFKLNDSDVKLKIVGGFSVQNRSDFAYQVSLRYGNYHICGGSIISENVIITAAHCCFHDNKPLKRRSLTVVAGDLRIKQNSNKTVSRKVSAVYIHPRYNAVSIQNDIALWKVSTPFVWNPYIQPIEITERKILPNTYCNVSGWGVTDIEVNLVSNNLRYVEVPIIRRSSCRKVYPEIDSMNVLCAGLYGKDSCQGDSGGALVCNKTLAGIVSYGEECGVFPGVYTDVYSYRYWIKNAMRTINLCSQDVPNVLLILFALVFMIFSRNIN